MTLRCKPGDMALIIRSSCGNEGKIVTCLEFIGKENDNWHANGDRWRIDRKIPWTDKSGRIRGEHDTISDRYLMPIRPDEIKGERLNESLLNIA